MNKKHNKDIDDNCFKFLLVIMISLILGYILCNSLFRDVEKTSFYKGFKDLSMEQDWRELFSFFQSK